MTFTIWYKVLIYIIPETPEELIGNTIEQTHMPGSVCLSSHKQARVNKCVCKGFVKNL